MERNEQKEYSKEGAVPVLIDIIHNFEREQITISQNLNRLKR
ncbi:hypothetical protein [Tetragenococcus halophilus]|nr:hypothetical protein [Tetragenococcus halophilus]GFK23078.1 hypothetical protein YA163_01410 [Tetragenococcus halophilus]GFK27708.1 hypothetical protein YG2_01420 [Tetragenococcus halophilus]GLL50179.1 hypothetical protein YA5_001500 [Tetragenococcus halophilus]GMA45098.1 hypothetical protein GCM10025853_25550 [Tetragenococcus halophilus subsp. halophilus DSM 20339]